MLKAAQKKIPLAEKEVEKHTDDIDIMIVQLNTARLICQNIIYFFHLNVLLILNFILLITRYVMFVGHTSGRDQIL